jgi:hypothetical protein
MRHHGEHHVQRATISAMQLLKAAVRKAPSLVVRHLVVRRLERAVRKAPSLVVRRLVVHRLVVRLEAIQAAE